METFIEAVQVQLKKSRINRDIQLVEHATYHSQIRKDLSPLVHYQAARFPTADVHLTQFYDSASIFGPPKAVTNFSHCNVADDEIRAARIETDPTKQKELWKEAQTKIIKAVCGVPVYEQLQLWAWKDSRLRTEGLTQSGAANHGEHAFCEMSFMRAQLATQGRLTRPLGCFIASLLAMT
jgi:peptide/nickel transport system substrate-binding protein